MAELADALDLGSSGLNHRGSSPLSRIVLIIKAFRFVLIFLAVLLQLDYVWIMTVTNFFFLFVS